MKGRRQDEWSFSLNLSGIGGGKEEVEGGDRGRGRDERMKGRRGRKGNKEVK